MIINKLKLRIWWYIYFGVQFLLVIFMIGCLGSEKWISSSIPVCSLDNYSTFCGVFEGSLSTCKKGCDNTYAEEYASFCVDIDIGDSDDINDSYCKMFAGLYFGAAVLIVFEMISFISIIV